MSYLDELKSQWNSFADIDPFWAILTHKGKKGSWNASEFFQTGIDEVDFLMRYLDSLNLSMNLPRRALDFGCGIGRITQPLAGYFNEVCGVDIAANFITLANRYNKYPNRCKYYLNERDDLAIFDNDSFDLVYSNIVLQHLKPEYSKKYIIEFLRVLAPNGLLIFQLPSESITLWGKVVWSLLLPLRSTITNSPSMEMNCVPTDDVIDLVIKNGASIVDVKQNYASGDHFRSFQYCVTKEK